MSDETPDTEQRVRVWAYHLWERDGRPFGRDHEYWERAKTLAGNDNSPGAAGQRGAAPAAATEPGADPPHDR